MSLRRPGPCLLLFALSLLGCSGTSTSAVTAASSAASSSAVPVKPSPVELPSPVEIPSRTSCVWQVNLDKPGQGFVPKLVSAASGRPFVTLRGGTARVTAIDGEEAMAYVEVTSAHLRINALASLSEGALRARGPIALGGVFTPSAKAPLTLLRMDQGRVQVAAPLMPPLLRTSIEQTLGCDQLSLEQETFDHAGPPLPEHARKVSLKPDTTVGFSAEPGGKPVIEARISERSLPPGVDGFLQVEDVRGKHSLARWGLAAGMLRGWVASESLVAAARVEEPQGKPVYDVSGASLAATDVPTERTRQMDVQAYAICDQEIPLIVQTDDELLLAGQIRPGTCINVLSSREAHARISMHVPDASFGAHVSLFVRSADVASCRLIEVSASTTPRDVPDACVDRTEVR